MLAVKTLKNQRGMAVMEIIPIAVIILLFFNYSLGFFGAIHTAILNSMSAKNYAFETFNHRSNLVYFRDSSAGGISYDKTGFRIHATISATAPPDSDKFIATERRIDFMENKEAVGHSKDFHNNQIYSIQDGKRYTASDGVNPIWVRPQYGICLDSICGPH